MCKDAFDTHEIPIYLKGLLIPEKGKILRKAPGGYLGSNF